jgi:hypothetical protein
MARCKTCDSNGIICHCKNPSRVWCDKRVCRGHTCQDCNGKSEPMVRDFVLSLTPQEREP